MAQLLIKDPMLNSPPSAPSKPAESEIEQALHVIENLVKSGSLRDWTQAINESFTKLGLQHNWGVCANVRAIKHEDVHKAWLFDLTWYSSPNGRLRELGLILESEWVKDFVEIQYDFEKLLIARAPYKVAIFDATEAERPKYFNDLKEIIKGYGEHAENEVYFLVAYSELRKGFVSEIVRPSLL